MSSCMIDYEGDGEVPEVFRESDRKARKEHGCSECGRRIEKGEKYKYAWGIYEGDQIESKTCSDCVSLEAFFCYSSPIGYLLEMVKESIFENDGEVDSEIILKLTPKSRDLVFGWIEECWGEIEEGFCVDRRE